MNSEPCTLDDIAAGLQQLRTDANRISYADIASGISRRRISSGLSPHAARISRATVYNYFQPGRSRMNAKIVFEIALILSGDEKNANQWRIRCINAQKSLIEEGGGEKRNTLNSDEANPAITTPKIDRQPKFVPINDISEQIAMPGAQFTALMLLAGVIVNLIPSEVSRYFFGDSFPLFFDMIGTALTAMVLGPWWGALAALVTALVTALIELPRGAAQVVLMLTPVSVIGGLAWGFGVHNYRLTSNLGRFLLLNTVVGVVCTGVAFPIIVAAFDSQAMHYMIQHQVDTLVSTGTAVPIAILMSNLFASVVDKVISGIVGLIGAGTLLRRYSPPAVVNLVSRP